MDNPLVNPGIGLIFWTAVTFLLVLFLLRMIAWKPILQALKEREDSIASALRTADEAREQMKQLKSDNEKLMQQAREERDKILKDAVNMSNQIQEQAREEAKKVSAKIIEDARQTIETEKLSALKEVKDQVARLSIEVAEKILREELKDQASQRKLVQDYLNDFKTN
jgi:F-type H+-transporting ATPase subunit b